MPYKYATKLFCAQEIKWLTFSKVNQHWIHLRPFAYILCLYNTTITKGTDAGNRPNRALGLTLALALD